MATASNRSKSPKTPELTSGVELVPQEHGGALQRGNPGNVGGVGRPPSVLREMLRGSFGERVGIIENIADGKPVQKIRVSLRDILPHVVCANCGEAQIRPASDQSAVLEFDAEGSASPRDRLAALDLQAKYGLGTTKELSVEHVRERVQRTIDVLRSRLDPDTLEAVLGELKPIWQ